MTSSSTCHNRRFRPCWLHKCAIAGLVTLCCADNGWALDSNRNLSQETRKSWQIQNGFPGGAVSAFAQTKDGYLWIGTDKGLIRFNGSDFQTFEQTNPSSVQISSVLKLLADPEGDLWILLHNTELLHFKDNRIDLVRGDMHAKTGITALGRQANGAMLLSSLIIGTLTFESGQFLPAGSANGKSVPRATGSVSDNEYAPGQKWPTGLGPHTLSAPRSAVTSLAGTADGTIWLGTADRGLFCLRKGQVSAVSDLGGARVNCLLTGEGADLWIGTSKGLVQWDGAKLTRANVPRSLMNSNVLSLLQDRDANIWVGTMTGVKRFSSHHFSLETEEIPSSGPEVTALFEDREGDVWIGGRKGIERVRDSTFLSYSALALRSQRTGPVYVDDSGYVWFAPIEGGLRWSRAGESGVIKAAGLDRDVVYSITGRGSELWIGRQHGGLTHLRNIHGSLTAKTYTQTEGLPQNTVYSVYEGHDGTVWAGTLNGGLSEFKNGCFKTLTKANGLASDTISSIAETADGIMWLGTPNGLTSMSGASPRTYDTHDGLPSPDINCLLPDSEGVLWVGTSSGLALLHNGRVRIPQGMPAPLQEQIFGIAEDGTGRLWVATAHHVLQVTRTSLLHGTFGSADVHEYGAEDELNGTEGVKRCQSVCSDSQGRIWFSLNRGLFVVNTARANTTAVAPLVHVEQIMNDNAPLNLQRPIRVPANSQSITFQFAGLSLAHPERVRYRFRLDPLDHSWSESVTMREAHYAHLGAGSYRFRVMASTFDKLWTGKEAVIGFEVEPTFWQTWWFRLGGALVLATITVALYRFRLRRLTRQLNIRFEERLAERTRIAQDLHDTLLQGLMSVSMQLHVAADRLPANSPGASQVARSLSLMTRVIEEGRNALRGLRSPHSTSLDLEEAFSQMQYEYAREGVSFRLAVDGPARPIRSLIRDEVYRIGREALVNAFHHSGATHIEVEINYMPRQLRVVVRDNGCGMDPQVLRSGREGHWGLPGMRERAEKIGAQLHLWSGLGSGTEVELSVPGHVAFPLQGADRGLRWSAKFLQWRRKRISPNEKVL